MPRTLAALLIFALLLGPTVARAQSSADADAAELETEARARFSLGQLYYAQARFEEAAAEFEAAYASHPHPLLLHNIYLARRDLGDFRGAVDALTRYLHDATDLSAAERRLLEGRLAAMERALPATTAVEDPVVGDTEPVETGEALADPAITLEAPTPARDEGPMTGAIVSFSVAGAAVLMMAITGPLALTERDNLAATCSPACTDAQVSTARTLGIVTDVGLGVASAGAIAGVTLAIIASLEGDATVAVAPSVSADHAALIVGGSF